VKDIDFGDVFSNCYYHSLQSSLRKQEFLKFLYKINVGVFSPVLKFGVLINVC
jgi:hypothetical protein